MTNKSTDTTDKAMTRTSKAERLARMPAHTRTVDDAGMIAAPTRGKPVAPSAQTMAVDPTVAAKSEYGQHYNKGTGKAARERVALVDGFKMGSKEQKAAAKEAAKEADTK